MAGYSCVGMAGGAVVVEEFRESLPGPVLGVIGGSSLLKDAQNEFTSLPLVEVPTPHGRVLLRAGPMAGGGSLCFVQRHEAVPGSAYSQPADINYAAIALALRKLVRAQGANGRGWGGRERWGA